jgi:hypothetical protein
VAAGSRAARVGSGDPAARDIAIKQAFCLILEDAAVTKSRNHESFL